MSIELLKKTFPKVKCKKDNALHLMLIGDANTAILESCKNDVIDLGVVEKQDKYNVYSAAS